MDKFIDDLEKIIVKNCYIEDNDKLRRYKNPNILVISFGLLKILDCALEYSNNSFIMQKDFFGPFEIEYLSTVLENVDDNIYINKIFNLEKLMNFDMDIVGFFIEDLILHVKAFFQTICLLKISRGWIF